VVLKNQKSGNLEVGMTTGIATTKHVHDSYRHEALFWSGIDEFVAGTAPFVAEGVDAGEPVLVAVPDAHWAPMREALGAAADRVHYVDMAELGANPARIIPKWRHFVDVFEGQPVRGVGEPIWPGRRSAEIDEGQVHEALLNIAIGPNTPLWLRCPYDLDGLDDGVLAAAQRSHPMLLQEGAYRGSTHYEGSEYADFVMGSDLPDPRGVAHRLEVGSGGGVDTARRSVQRWALQAGVGPVRADDLALAVHEVVVNSILHGGGSGLLQVWHEDDAFVCEVRDHGTLDNPLAGRSHPADEHVHGRGLWMVNQLCDLVQIRSTSEGTVVRLLTWL
jgi:anti-sigma regulatory factor (Ser/Thr protein kinase)